MRYIPDFTVKRIGKEDEDKNKVKQKRAGLVDDIYDLPRNPVTDTTSFIVKSTTVDLEKLSDPRFKERNELLILAVNMFPALSNLQREDRSITRAMWKNMVYGIKLGCMRYAEQKALELIHYYNESRGMGGRFSMQLITTREELIARHKKEEEETKKKGFWGFTQPKEETEDMGVDGEFTK